jgi:hypothetical protein
MMRGPENDVFLRQGGKVKGVSIERSTISQWRTMPRIAG